MGREGIGTHWALVRAGFYIHTLCVCVSPSSIPVVNIIMLVLFNMLLSSLLLNSQGLVPFHTWSYPVLFYTAAASSSPSPSSSSSSSHHVCGLYVHRCVHVCVCRYTHPCAHVNRPKRTSDGPLCHSLLYSLETGSLTEVELCWQPTNPLIFLSPAHIVLSIYRHKSGHTFLLV